MRALATTLAAVSLFSCGISWRPAAEKTLLQVADGALTTQEIARPAIKAGCMKLAEKCFSEGRKDYAKCPELKKCVDSLRGLNSATEATLALIREAIGFIKLGDKAKTQEYVGKALEALLNLKDTYDKIRKDIDDILSK